MFKKVSKFFWVDVIGRHPGSDRGIYIWVDVNCCHPRLDRGFVKFKSVSPSLGMLSTDAT